MAALLSASACLGGTTETQLPAGSGVAVALSQVTQQVAVNQPTVSAITITRLKGFPGVVTLSLDSLPAGVTATFDPSALEGAATTSILTFTAVDSAVAKTTSVKLKATALDANTDSVVLALTVVKGALTLNAGAAAASAPQGASATVPLSISRSNGFKGAVTLVADDLPANVTATFAPALLPTAQTVSTLTLSALAGATPGTYPVTVRARSTGQADKTSVIQFTVTSSTTAGFSLSASPATFSLAAGTSAQSVITPVRTGGFAGAITVTVAGAPAGVTAVVTPNAAVAGTSVITFATTAATVPGSYTLLVSAAATGQTTRVIPIGLTITAVPAVTVSVSPTALRIAPGGFAQAAVLLTRVGGLTGDFVMTAENLPTGVTATFSPSPVIATVTTLTLSATTAAPTGVYNVVIKAAAGSDVGTATITLTVGASALRN